MCTGNTSLKFFFWFRHLKTIMQKRINSSFLHDQWIEIFLCTCNGSVFVPTCRDTRRGTCSGSVFVPTCRDTWPCTGNVMVLCLYLPVESLEAVHVVVLCLYMYLPVETLDAVLGALSRLSPRRLRSVSSSLAFSCCWSSCTFCCLLYSCSLPWSADILSIFFTRSALSLCSLSNSDCSWLTWIMEFCQYICFDTWRIFFISGSLIKIL